MHKPDFYFEQLVTESFLDLVFDWVEQADLDTRQDILCPLDGISNPRGAIHSGGGVNPTVSPSMSVRVAAAKCTDADGRRVYWPSEEVIDCSEDYTGAPTDVAPTYDEKYLAIFAEFDRELADQRLDGNGVPVWTKQYESYAIKVYAGSDAASGSAVPPATPSGMIRLANVKLNYGQTQILQTDIEYDTAGGFERDDWVRETGSELGSFVFGIPSKAITQLFVWLNSVASGQASFSATATWRDTTSLSSTTMINAVNEILSDLYADAGSNRIGAAAWASPNGHADLSSGSIQSQLRSLGTDIDAHIAGGAPNHDANTISGAAYQTHIIYTSQTSLMSVGQDLISESGGTAVIVEYLSPSHLRVGNKTGTWDPGDGVDLGTTYSAPHFFYLNTITDDPALSATDVQATLQSLTDAINERMSLIKDQKVMGQKAFHETVYLNGPVQSMALLGGTQPNMPIEDLISYKPNNSIVQALPYHLEESLSVSTGSDMCAAIEYTPETGMAPRASVLIAAYNAANIRRVYLDYNDPDLTETSYTINVDASDTTLAAGENVAAIACNGEMAFVLIDAGGGGTNSYLMAYALDERSTSQMKWLWTVQLTSYSCGTAPYAETKMVATDSYVYICFGGEDPVNTPLVRVTISSQAIVNGNGGHSGSGYSVTGAFAVNAAEGYYVVTNGTNDTKLIPFSLSTLAASGSGVSQLATDGRSCIDLVAPGRFVICPLESHATNTEAQIFVRDMVSSWSGTMKLMGIREAGYPVKVCFDGQYLWFICLSYYPGSAGSGAIKRCAIPYHLSRLAPGTDLVEIDGPRHFLEQPSTSGSSADCGISVAWGPGIWHLPTVGSSSVVRLFAGAGAIVN